MLEISSLSLALVDELFQYKFKDFKLPLFPGYTDDQWGIKAHNRPWIEEVGDFKGEQKIIEVGGAYSLLPHYLSEKYSLEAWVGDDFGASDNQGVWKRWGNPFDLQKKYPSIKYVFEPFGKFSESYPDNYFDRIFTVSTLEHIAKNKRLNVIKDMNRCLKDGGVQLHTIDIPIPTVKRCIIHSFSDKLPWLEKVSKKLVSDIRSWISVFEQSGIEVKCSIPDPISLLERKVLVESPDVVYRFHPPNNQPKSYEPNASLLVVIEKDKSR